jgi:fructose-bisphosphate aldolase class II
LSLQENLDISAKLLERFAKNDLVLEIETGAVGGEEDDVVGDHAAKLYTTPEDTLEVARRLNSIGGRYLLAATFGNVHGVYKPGHAIDDRGQSTNLDSYDAMSRLTFTQGKGIRHLVSV